jgi:4-carboxymuconolactone decarboxylase
MNDAIDTERRALMAAIGIAGATGGAGAALAQAPQPAASDGAAIMRQLGGGPNDALAAFSPDLAQLNQQAVGDYLGRPQLPLKARELVSVAAITVLASAPAALKFHIRGMLHTGWRPAEVVEVIIHALVYAGLPPAQNAMLVAREVFREQGVAYRPTSGRPAGADWPLGVTALANTGGNAALEMARSAAADEGLTADFDRMAVEFAHGEIWNRPALSIRDRELATLAMLIAGGNAASAIRYHAAACLRTGWTRAETTEVLIQLTAYAGWPLALAAVAPMAEAFAAARMPADPADPAAVAALAASAPPSPTDEARYTHGVEAMGKISRASGEAVVNGFKDIAPDLGRYIMEFAYGEVFSRPGLDLKTRELATVAALTVRGSTADATPLRVHVAGALNTGATRTEIIEAILHMIPYAGFPRVQAAIALAGEAFAEADKAR